MFCFKCGAEISDESDFCMKCGTEILHHNKTEIEEVNSISTIPMNATIKSAFVSTIIVSETEISYKSGLKSETIKVSDISDIRYTAVSEVLPHLGQQAIPFFLFSFIR